MQLALQQVQQVCNDSQKKKFSDLFSLLDTNDEPEVSVSGGRRPARGQGNKRAAATTNRSANTTNNSNRSSNNKKSNKDESEEESSDDDVYLSRPKQAKMRRKAPIVGSDSDWLTK